MLCYFADRFPLFVAQFLERGEKLKRKFREETITDLVMGNMVLLGGRSVIVEFPDERITGADMEWNFVNPDDKTCFRLLIQAKRSFGKDPDWKRHIYRELWHRTGIKKRLQAEILIEASKAKGAYPLYMFYHPSSTCELAHQTGNHQLQGINIADGFIVAKLAHSKERNLGKIYPLLFLLKELLCPISIRKLGPMALAQTFALGPLFISMGKQPSLGYPIPPRPIEIHDRLVAVRNSIKEFIPAGIELPAVPEVLNQIPDDILSLISDSRSSKTREATLPYWRVTFISASPAEDPFEKKADQD